MSAREEIMTRIQRALSDAPERRGADAPVLERPQPLGVADQGLAAQFRSEMEKLGGRVTEAGPEEKIIEYINGLLGGCARVAVSDLVSARWPAICDLIRAKGIEIVPALREFTRPVEQRQEPDVRREPDQASLFGNEREEAPAARTASRSTGNLMESYKLALFDAGVGITTADYAIADTGTIVLLSKKEMRSGGDSSVANETAGVAGESGARADGEQHRFISLVPPIHVCLLDKTRIVANLTELLTLVHRELYLSSGPPLAMTFISGPSRTADIELTLTRGVHGPREVHVLMLDGGKG